MNRYNIKDNKTGAVTQFHKLNTENKLHFAYKSQYNISDNTSTNEIGENNCWSNYEKKINEKTY